MTSGASNQPDTRISRRAALGTLAAAAGAAAFGPLRSHADLFDPSQHRLGAVATRSAERTKPVEARRRWYETSLGSSVEGRPIMARHSLAVTEERHRVIIVGTIHGDEPGSRPAVEGMSRAPVPDDITFSMVPMLNPDAWSTGTRRNANDVDLNRNFPWGWGRSGFHGRSPASEPETQAIMSFIVAGAFDLAIWVHQPLGYVAPIRDCPGTYADAWQAQVGDRRRNGVTQSGGGESWCAFHLGISSMLIEIDGRTSTPEKTDAHVRGFVECMQAVSAQR